MSVREWFMGRKRVAYRESGATTEGKCNQCRFWKPDPFPSKGECRRRAPVVVDGKTYGSSTAVTFWPTTESKDGCGDWEAKA